MRKQEKRGRDYLMKVSEPEMEENGREESDEGEADDDDTEDFINGLLPSLLENFGIAIWATDTVRSETKQLKDDVERITMAKGQVCSQILEKQRKLASLESDASTLAQTLELIQQERIALSAKLTEMSAYYMKVAELMNGKLQEQQDWINSHKATKELEKHGMEMDANDEQTAETGGNSSLDIKNLENDPRKDLMAKLDSAKAKFEEISKIKSKLVMENTEMKQVLEKVKCRENDFKPELRTMEIENLEKEYNALLSDKARETDYFQSLQSQFEKLKGISHVVKCACGEEYQVGLDLCARQNETHA
ncbi:hypothetical protein FEM48_Zijuj08G0070700 [Ziziphus jujuba var. spinosa]|uniref:Uncharacterized protein n=1 Tax=Ziziphus jujuba var. spinosa TaxID=714518 RepID=A0A978UXN8_ZIZJJ|nr:hypothetical protein FEM48_Zijuj08G0070700 [Ziziphus jujuba var. spinosa]